MKRLPTGGRTALVALGITIAAAVYLAGVPNHPPGFYIDESSIAYNAFTIAQTGCDEHGLSWPLYFQAFGDFKNPVYIYALAVIFRFAGPSIVAARIFSAVLGLTAVLLLGILTARLAQSTAIVVIVTTSALLTPWLYESSRLVFEVAAYPLVIVLFLLALKRATAKASWGIFEVTALAITLALLTYTYSIGRLLGPLFALGLILFWDRKYRKGILVTWCSYAVTLIPLLFFSRRHTGALTDRFKLITYLGSDVSFLREAWEFLKHYAANINPWAILVTGENNPRDHLGGFGAVLFPTLLLATAGLILVLKNHRNDPWWRFVIYALATSIVPASLTVNAFPQLRLVVVPVLLHVLSIPALCWLVARSARRPDTPGKLRVPFWQNYSVRIAIAALVATIILQGAYFQWSYHRQAPARWYFMDARFKRKIFDVAIATEQRPIYLYDGPGQSSYIQSYWYGALSGIPASQFTRLFSQPASPGSVVISSEKECMNCRPLARGINHLVYVVLPSDVHAEVAALPAHSLRAEISSRGQAPIPRAHTTETFRVSLRNVGDATWPSVGDDKGRHAIDLKARWLSLDGVVLAQAGSTALPYDVEPLDVADVDLSIIPPGAPGEYLLEIDLRQEPDSWFHDSGSSPLRIRLIVSD